MSAEINILTEKLLRRLPQAGLYNSAIDGLSFARRDTPMSTPHCFYKPMAILVLQGKKQIIAGSETMAYQAGDCVVNSVDIPTAGTVLEAAADKPFLTMALNFDNQLLAQLIAEMPPADIQNQAERGIGLMPASDELLTAFSRLLDIEQDSSRRRIMAPLLLKEIYFLLLTSSLGRLLLAVNTTGTRNNQIARAVAWLKEHFREPLKIAELARQVNMTESSFYRHFNAVTSISPLQYQKQLRLQEAQRLLLTEHISAENAGYRVGYESPSQFTREYKRMFGCSPALNARLLRS